ncbi:MAG: cache domain-containing protein, partial [Leptospirillia bacterium]
TNVSASPVAPWIRGAAGAAPTRPRHYDFSDTEWWKAVIEKEEPYLSGIVHSEEENTFLFNMAVPVRDKLGQVIGALYMVHNAPRFFQVVTEVTSGRSDHTMLVSSDGVVIFCPILPIKSHLLSQSHQQLVLRDKPGWVSSLEDIHYSGEYAINGFAPVSTTFSSSPHNFGGNRWYILTSQDPEEAFAPIYDLLKWVALSGVLGALVVAILGSITARSIIRPIQTLREGVEFISGGNLEHTITVHSGDEIEDLAKAFNQMGEKLKASYSGLEAKIAERTRELEANNRELFALYAIVSSLQQAPGQDDGFVDALNKIMVTVPSDAIVLTEFATGANTTLHAAPRSLLEDTNFTKALDTLENHLKEEKQALTIEDLRDSAQFNLLERDLGFLGVHSMPIIVKSRLMGILHLFNREPRVYTATERTLVNSITNQLGTTLENVQLSR